MPPVVGVHGIAQQFKGPNVLRTEWLPALRDGLWLAGVKFPQDDDLVCTSYGELFRPPGTKAVGIPLYDGNDVKDDWEQELLEAWWREATAVEEGVPGPEAETKAIRTPRFVQRALDALSQSRFFAGIAERAFIFDLKQVRSYLHDQAIRQAVRERVEQVVAPETRVMVGHSLGSVVAYECLCVHPEWSIHTLVTLGSPLGIRNLIFDLLEPAPQDGIGAWPGSVQRWINIADGGDIVALVKDLRPRFGERVENHLIYNGATAHDIKPYLTAKETGNAIATGLRKSKGVASMPNAFTHGYALLIGVGESAYPPWSLPVTVKDIQAIRAILTDPNLCAYPDNDQHIRLLHDKTATRAAIVEGLAWLKERAATDPEAIAVVFYSGHGWLDPATGRYYLIPHDVEPSDVADWALPAQEFTDALRDIKTKRLLVMIDCCHAEGMATAKEGPAAIKLPKGLVQTTPPKGLVEQLKQGEGRAVFTSSRGQQVSWIRPDGSLSIYTHHLVEALQGAGNKPGDTVVRLSNLMNHLGKAVLESARTLCQAEQVPFFDAATEDFAVAMLRGGKGLPPAGWEGVKQEAAETIRHVVNVLASGERAVAIGGDVNGGTIITGDRMETRSSSQ